MTLARAGLASGRRKAEPNRQRGFSGRGSFAPRCHGGRCMKRLVALVVPAMVFATTLRPGLAQDRVITTEKVRVKVETVAGNLEHPWGLAFRPDGRMLVTERPGRLRIVAKEGAVSEPIAGVPVVQAEGQPPGGSPAAAMLPGHGDTSTEAMKSRLGSRLRSSGRNRRRCGNCGATTGTAGG